MRKRLCSIMLAMALLIGMVISVMPASVIAKAAVYTENVKVHIDGKEAAVVRAMHYDYLHNMYLSVRDLAALLSGTAKNFEFSISKANDETCFKIETGKDYGAVGGENTPFENTLEALSNSRKRLSVFVDDVENRFYVIQGNNVEGKSDCFMSAGELAISLNLNMYFENGELYIDTQKDFDLTIEDPFGNDFFYFASGCVVGDATTGEIYYALDADKSVPIASTTKLMTYLVIMDAVSAGEISDKDMVSFSAEAERISKSGDGVVPVTEGQKAPFKEVVAAMLIKSSNECALALAEHLSGSETEFVKRMGLKARELGLSDGVRFFNSNGLPVYPDDVVNTKVQNRMTANDMFIIASAIFDRHPEVIEITSAKEMRLESLNFTAKNTNVLLYNMPNTVGLKTGTTSKAKSCLVSAMEKTDDNGEIHYLVSVEFGAEDAQVQSFGSTMLLKYADTVFDGSKDKNNTGDESPVFPDNASKLYDALVKQALGHLNFS